MESKFIIFVVLAILAQNSFVRSLSVDYGLSDDELSNFSQILSNQDATVQAKFDGFDPIFDIIAKYAAELIYGLEATTDDDSTKVAGALVRVKDAIDYSLDAILIGLGESCAAIETARTDTHTDLEDAYAAATEALSLALAGNFSANRAEIEKYQAQVQTDLANLVKSVYDSFTECRGTTDDGEISVIEAAREGSGAALVHVSNALFNAVKVLADAYSTGSADVILIYSIENYRNLAHVGLRADVENKFSGIKAIYIARLRDLDELASELGAIQYGETILSYRNSQAFTTMGRLIQSILQKVTLGLYDAGEDDFSYIDHAQAIINSKIQAGSDMILDIVVAVNPEAASIVEELRTKISVGTTQRVIDYIGGITSALAGDTEGIKTHESAAHETMETYINDIFDAVYNGQVFSNETATQLTGLHTDALGIGKDYVGTLFDGFGVLANALKAEEVTSDDYASLIALRSEGLSAPENYSNKIFMALQLVAEFNTAN